MDSQNMNRRELIEQLSQELGMNEKAGDERSVFVGSTGTMFVDDRIYEEERQKRDVVKEDDPWSKLELKPNDFK